MPHPPQFDGSLAVFTQAVGEALGHFVGYAAGQLQVPEEQTSFVRPHAVPQAPQLDGSLAVFTQAVGEAVWQAVP